MERAYEVISSLQDLNYEGMQLVQKALRELMDNTRSLMRYNFSVGDSVTFESKGNEVVGIVQKINKKSIGVFVKPYTNWRVSPGLLSKT